MTEYMSLLGRWFESFMFHAACGMKQQVYYQGPDLFTGKCYIVNTRTGLSSYHAGLWRQKYFSVHIDAKATPYIYVSALARNLYHPEPRYFKAPPEKAITGAVTAHKR